LDNPILVLERFFPGGGWIEVLLAALYGAFLGYKMQNSFNVGRYRRVSWGIFSIVFFGQLVLGVLVSDNFLMTGTLHIPVPAIILAGPIYRGEVTFMVFLFLSTVILTGPSWCSHLCYFGGLDNFAAGSRAAKKNRLPASGLSHTTLAGIILVSLAFRIFQADACIALLAGVVVGVLGIIIILVFSTRYRIMVHCTHFCPIGTVVRYLKYINPFRMEIASSCTGCMRCTTVCKYDALRAEHINNRKIGATCMYCGDCIAVCHPGALRYRFLGLPPERARSLYLGMTITLHVVFLALAKV
jgi:polyferredoxin